MANIDLNAVLDNEYQPRTGDKYEVAPGKWGTMPKPTGAVLEEIQARASEDGVSELELVRTLMKDLPPFDDKEAVPGMAVVVMSDFFILQKRIAERVKESLARYEQ